MRTPIARVKGEDAADKSPVARRPQQSRLGGLDPDSGDPIIVVIVPGPVARRPIIAGGWNGRLTVLRQGRRRLVGLNEVAAAWSGAARSAGARLREGWGDERNRRAGADDQRCNRIPEMPHVKFLSNALQVGVEWHLCPCLARKLPSVPRVQPQ